MQPLLEIDATTKRFGVVLACDDVSLTVEQGELHGLLGQNGAGKSTLMKIVAGLERADHGQVQVGGLALPPGDPKASRSAGVGMVHQHFSLVEPLSVWENVALGATGRLDERIAVRRVGELGERYGLVVDPHATVGVLSPGERQRVEIIKCLRDDPRLIILDEPTSVLTHAESSRLFDVLGMLVRENDRAIVLISHRLEEVLNVTDRITILRSGAVVRTVQTSDADVNLLATEMLGRPVSLGREASAVGVTATTALDSDSHAPAGVMAATASAESPVAIAPVLEIDHAVVIASDGHRVLNDLSIHVRAGEILGLAGVEGNGQLALGDLLSGLLRLNGGKITVDGEPMRAGQGRDPRQIGVVPPDRHASGCVLELSIAENLILDRPEEVQRFGILSRRLMRERAARLVADYRIATPSVDLPVGALSGGNQQRVVLARELSRTPKVLSASQPTQGLDVGAMEDIWDRLRAAAAAGAAVLVISTDLDEIMAISDRIGVIYRGQIIGEMPRFNVDLDRLGRLMGGAAA